MAYTRITYAYLLGAVTSALKNSFADSDIDPQQSLFWIKLAVNRVKAKSLMKMITGSYLTTFTDVPVAIQYKSNVSNILVNRKYIELPTNVIDLPFDQGVPWMAYQKKVKSPLTTLDWSEPISFSRAESLSAVQYMKHNPFEQPTEANPSYVRADKRLYLFGIEGLPFFKVDIGLFTAIPANGDMSMLAEEVMINDEQAMEVISSVLSIERWIMLVPSERVIEGADSRQIPAYKQLSPNLSGTPLDQGYRQQAVNQQPEQDPNA